jgi:hypothetical protein
MGRAPNINEAQDIMREDQMQFERTIVRLRSSKSQGLLDASKLGEFPPEVSGGQAPQGLPSRKTVPGDT